VHAVAFGDRERDDHSSYICACTVYVYIRHHITIYNMHLYKYNSILIDTMLTSAGLINRIKLYSQRRRPRLFTVYEDGSINALH
jgi:hypothetical protein